MTALRPMVLFDLDGTLIDTAPEFLVLINAMKRARGHAEVPMSLLRPSVSNGTKGMIETCFNALDTDPAHEVLRKELLDAYALALGEHSALFDGMEAVLDALESQQIGWGIVTNKPGLYTRPLLENMGLAARCTGLACRDEVPIPKPDPAGLFLACERGQGDPASSIYVGDHERDIEAGRRAGMKTVAAAWGYIPESDAPENWGADYVAGTPADLLNWLQQHGPL